MKWRTNGFQELWLALAERLPSRTHCAHMSTISWWNLSQRWEKVTSLWALCASTSQVHKYQLWALRKITASFWVSHDLKTCIRLRLRKSAVIAQFNDRKLGNRKSYHNPVCCRQCAVWSGNSLQVSGQTLISHRHDPTAHVVNLTNKQPSGKSFLNQKTVSSAITARRTLYSTNILI